MKLITRLLLSIFIVMGIGVYGLTYGMLENIRIRYLEGVEETMVDQARILAGIAARDIEQGTFFVPDLHRLFDTIYSTQFLAEIYQLKKKRVDLRVYITDKSGKVLFDSIRKSPPGTDYSDWRDVYLTLQGRYGARSSREDERYQESSVLYVAAPILVNGTIEGVLTVAKPTKNINSFIVMARSKFMRRIIVTVAFVTVCLILVIFFITRPIKLLTDYANDIRDGKKALLPRLDSSEIGVMGRAFESMRESLENRKYVETYVQTLTHEIKSPISTIKGAAELLEEDMPAEQRSRFIHNIRNESERIGMLVERMLKLSSLENLKTLRTTQRVNFTELAIDVIEWFKPLVSVSNVTVKTEIAADIRVTGESFLLKQAISNLIQNSIDFSPPGSTIAITLSVSGDYALFTVADQGPGIPDYAKERVFEKFFSLRRPLSGEKSTGLGLNFVKEITQLHQGWIRLTNREQGGVVAILELPVDAP